jgi:hypothetical protein
MVRPIMFELFTLGSDRKRVANIENMGVAVGWG